MTGRGPGSCTYINPTIRKEVTVMDQYLTRTTCQSPTVPTRNGTPVTRERLDASSASPVWNDPSFVLELSTTDPDEIAYWRTTVAPVAHRLAHPRPVFGCPGCPPGAVDEDRTAEIHVWRKAVAA